MNKKESSKSQQEQRPPVSMVRKIIAFDPDALDDGFDLVAAVSEENLFETETEPLNLYSVPRYLKVAVKKHQRKAHQVAAARVAKSDIIGVALRYGLECLRGTPESEEFLGVLEVAESSDVLSLADELLLDEAIEGFKFTPRDPSSGYERWTVRVAEEVKKDLYSTRSLLRMEVSSLASVCLGRALANQAGVNPEASKLMTRTYEELCDSFRSRAAYLNGLVAMFEKGK